VIESNGMEKINKDLATYMVWSCIWIFLIIIVIFLIAGISLYKITQDKFTSNEL